MFQISKTQLVPFNGLTPNLHITPEIVLDENAEELVEHQLREWGKISHITADTNAIRIRYFSEELPDVPLGAKITVWNP